LIPAISEASSAKKPIPRKFPEGIFIFHIVKKSHSCDLCPDARQTKLDHHKTSYRNGLPNHDGVAPGEYLRKSEHGPGWQRFHHSDRSADPPLRPSVHSRSKPSLRPLWMRSESEGSVIATLRRRPRSPDRSLVSALCAH
jgi:hypothetical protein